MLEVKNASKSYYKMQAMEDINLIVNKGEIHGLIGENSAGKTTLIKCLVGIYRLDSGDILYDGKPVYDNPEVKEKIAYVSDYNEYIPGYNIKRIVKLYKNFYEGFDENRFDELNSIFKLNKSALISSLSKGQKMRLAFMLSIAQNSDYIILDEPTSGLDVIGKNQLLDIIVSEVENRQVGVLISSHNLSGLETICDKVTMMKNGKIDLQGDIDVIKEKYAKLQIVFEGGFPRKMHNNPRIIGLKNVGSIYTIVVENMDDVFISELRNGGATLIEEIPITLEELFIYANKEADGDETIQKVI